MYIVAFNGPPQCGKDTLAGMLAAHMDSQRVSAPALLENLSYPLRVIAYSMVGKNYAESRLSLAIPYESFKKRYFEQFARTGRELMIDVSERFLKQVYEPEIMAKMLLARLENVPSNTVVLLCDSGFQLEVDPLIRECGSENVCIVQVHRPGLDFLNDSREWVHHPDPHMQLGVNNDLDLAHLRTEAGRICERLVNRVGWTLA